MEKRAHGNRLHCQTPSSAPSQSQPFLLGIATLPHFVLVRDSTPYKYPYISRSSRREAESEKNLRSGKKILASRISNPYFEAVSRPKRAANSKYKPNICHQPIYTVCPYRITCRQVPSDQDIKTRDASHSFFIVLCEATRGTTGERTAPVAYIKGR